jgi:hypothetical protein
MGWLVFKTMTKVAASAPVAGIFRQTARNAGFSAKTAGFRKGHFSQMFAEKRPTDERRKDSVNICGPFFREHR